MKWSYGVTTVPSRREKLLPLSLRLLERGGFDQPRLFIDGADGFWGEYPKERQTLRYPTIRTAGNWVLSLYELYIREPEADRYAVFQDDFVTYKNLRQYLEACPFPEKGYWNLYTAFAVNEPIIRDKPVGWYEGGVLNDGRVTEIDGKPFQAGRGAVALAFNRAGVVALLTSPHMSERPQDVHRGWRAVDGGIVTAMNKAGYREYVHNPSLVQHIGDDSSMGNRAHRKAETFRGEEFDCLSLIV